MWQFISAMPALARFRAGLFRLMSTRGRLFRADQAEAVRSL